MCWPDSVGASVQAEELLRVATDTVAVEIEAPSAGKLLETKTREYRFATCKALVAVIEAEN